MLPPPPPKTRRNAPPRPPRRVGVIMPTPPSKRATTRPSSVADDGDAIASSRPFIDAYVRADFASIPSTLIPTLDSICGFEGKPMTVDRSLSRVDILGAAFVFASDAPGRSVKDDVAYLREHIRTSTPFTCINNNSLNWLNARLDYENRR